jgi:hypothetical protein
MAAPKYDTINNGNIILSHEYPPDGRGTLGGRLVLVDREDQYVVAVQSKREGVFDREWGNGDYHPHNEYNRVPQSRALANALDKYREKLARILGNDGAA